jgi:hypothetical protein
METLDELYASVRVLIAELREAGHEDAAARLRAGMDGTTSGEVLENLWFALREVRPEVPEVDRVDDALAFIDRALGPPERGR